MPTITFTPGNDSYIVNAADSFTLDFLDGVDTLTVQHASATVNAVMGLGNDVVSLKAGTSTVHGNGGDDRFELYIAGTVYGDSESDLFNIRGGTGLIADGGSEDDRFNFVAGSSNVLLHGGPGNDDFFGYNKAITGAVHGDSGNDYFIEFRGSVSLYGGSGNDIYRADASSPANFVELAGEGIDSVQVARGVVAFTLPANLDNISVQGFSGSIPGPSALIGNALGNTIVAHNNMETIAGLDGNDRLSAKGGNDTVYGGAGNDYLDGGTGDDTLQGDAGNDTLQGRTGDDAMSGGAGNDVYYVDSLSDTVAENASAGIDLVRVSVTGYLLAPNVENGILSGTLSALYGNEIDNDLTGNTGDNSMAGNGGNDTIHGGAGGDSLYGNSGDDVLFGGDSSDTLHGEEGDDTLSGGLGGNALYGEAGNDILAGGDGSELLAGGAGTDTITTGSGPDKVDYYAVTDSLPGSSDLIGDFDAASDVLDLSAIDANTTIVGDQDFTLYSSKPAIGTPGDLWTVYDDSVHLTLFGDVNGDTFADFELRIVIANGVFEASDILL